MVQVLPGFAPQVGQNIASILGSIGNVIDPDYEVKQQIKQKVLADPAYAQQLANFAYANPDAYKKMGMGKLGDIIGEISPDLKAVMQEAQKGFVAKAAKDVKPELEKEAGQQALYGRTEADLRKDQLGEIQAGVNIALARQRMKMGDQEIYENDRKIQQLDLAGKAIEDATANYTTNKNINLGTLANDFIAGKANTDLVGQVMSTPQLAGQFSQYLDIIKEKRRLQQQKDLYYYQHGMQRKTIAQDMFLRTRAGTPEMWEKYMTDDKTQKRLSELIADP